MSSSMATVQSPGGHGVPAGRTLCPAPGRPFLKTGSLPQTPAATWVSSVWLLTQTVSGEDKSNAACLHPCPALWDWSFPDPEAVMSVCMYTGTRRVLSLAATITPTHAHTCQHALGALQCLSYVPMGRTSLSFITRESSGLTCRLFVTELCISSSPANR